MARLALCEVRGLLVDLWDKLSGEEGPAWLAALAKFLRKENPWEVVAAAAQNIFSIVVDYSKSLAEMITSGNYDSKNSDITEENFPGKRNKGTEEVRLELIHLNRVISSKKALSEFDRMGFRAGTLPELLAFGAKYPDEQRKYPVVGLGSVSRRLDGGRGVAGLGRDGSGRSLGLGWFGGSWGPGCRFLAVRKPRTEA